MKINQKFRPQITRNVFKISFGHFLPNLYGFCENYGKILKFQNFKPQSVKNCKFSNFQEIS